MTQACELLLTHSDTEFPEALRDAALLHLSQATGRSLDELRQLLRLPRPVVASVQDAAAAEKLQAELLRSGWRTELRPVSTSPSSSGLPAPTAVSSVACRACGHANPPAARFCVECGANLSGLPVPSNLAPARLDPGVMGAAINTVAGIVGLQGIQRFSVGDMLAEVFKRRTPSEIENHMLVGTLQTTPAVADVPTDWPRPWLFARLFVSSLLLYLIFYISLMWFGGARLLPAMMVVGCMVVPLSAVLIFYEFNAPANISLLLVARLVAVGGTISLLFSLILFTVFPELERLMDASSAGLIEETGKLAAVVYATRKLSPVRYRYTLNGLVFGAAVGAGFAAFESAGYAMELLTKGFGVRPMVENVQAMLDNIQLRGLLAPFGHVLWTALSAGALWRVKGALSYSGTMLAEWRFLRIFLLGVICHVIWNTRVPFLGEYYWIKHVVLGMFGWAVALSLIQDGLLQVKREQQSAA